MKPSSSCALAFLLCLILGNVPLKGATHTLAITTTGSGYVSRNPTNSAYPNGAVVTLTAVASNGWQFSFWSGGATGGSNPLNVTMDADKVITATFSQIASYELNVAVSGQGTVNPPGGTYLSNSLVTLTATPANGWVFGEWTGDVTGTANPLAVTLNSGKNVTAVFGESPSIVTQPQNVEVATGGTATFQVQAQGSEQLAYQWQRDGAPLSGANSSTLSIASAAATDAGQYRVVVSNKYGAATSQEATLTISDQCSGSNVVTVCDENQLRAAITKGGLVRFCCNSPILLTSTIEVARDVALDARQYTVSIDGNNAVRLFKVLTNVQFSATNLLLVNGRYVGANGSAGSSSSAPTPGEDGLGGAILNQGGKVSLISCVLSNNSSEGGRAGIDDPSGPIRRVPAGTGRGGAIMNLAGTLYFQSVLAISNRTVGGSGSTPLIGAGQLSGPGLGGAIASQEGTVVISNSLFVGNISTGRAGRTSRSGDSHGGAVQAEDGSLLIGHSVFDGNLAIVQPTGDFGGLPGSSFGGALSVYSGTAAVLESQFLNNGATGGAANRFSGTGLGKGGAIYNRGVLQINNCSFSTNEANGGRFGDINQPGQGGGLCNDGTAILNGSTWHHNSARGGPAGSFGSPFPIYPGGDAQGGAWFNGGNLFATNCTLAWNQGVAGEGASPQAPGGTISGGGIHNAGSNVVLMNVTIARNSLVPAPRSPDPMGANLANTNAMLSLRNSLVAYGNGAPNAWGSIADNGFNMSSDGSCAFASGSSFNFTDPKLDELGNYGGPTLTMALLPESPAIDFGTTIGAPSIDQRRMSRPFGDGVDMGAYERGFEPPKLFIRVVGPMVEVSFLGQAGKTYELRGSSDLAGWETLETFGPLAASGIVSRSLSTERTKLFFRLQAE